MDADQDQKEHPHGASGEKEAGEAGLNDSIDNIENELDTYLRLQK